MGSLPWLGDHGGACTHSLGLGQFASANANPPKRTCAQVVLKRVTPGQVHAYGGSTGNFHVRDSQPTKWLPHGAQWTQHAGVDRRRQGQHRGYRVRVVSWGLRGAATVRRDVAMACLETFLIAMLQTVVGHDMFSLGQGSAACRNVSSRAIHQCAPQPP